MLLEKPKQLLRQVAHRKRWLLTFSSDCLLLANDVIIKSASCDGTQRVYPIVGRNTVVLSPDPAAVFWLAAPAVIIKISTLNADNCWDLTVSVPGKCCPFANAFPGHPATNIQTVATDLAIADYLLDFRGIYNCSCCWNSQNNYRYTN